jgi:glyceraldehyde-3-phosphate dehydrogenase/erythrose-4-phosphate dehydrogenase
VPTPFAINGLGRMRRAASGDSPSAIVYLSLTRKARGLYRIVDWYDNEWGHTARLVDAFSLVGGILT